MGKIKDAFNNLFSKPQPISGGNSFEVYTKQVAQNEYNSATIPTDLNTIESTLNEIFQEQNYNYFQLLNFQANYYCNRKIFIAKNDLKLSLIIKHIVRQAFFNGVSAFYMTAEHNYRILYISKIEYDLSGNISKIVARYSNVDYDYRNDFNAENFRKVIIEGPALTRVAVFYWNDWKMGAYYWLLPFLKQQESLLKIIATTRYSYLKKFTYDVKNPAFIKDEIKLFYNENNPFLSNLSEETDLLRNRFNVFSFGNNDIENLKQYYVLFMEVHYKLFGRRMNDDNKDERNISGEIEATQANYDVLEKETFFYLKLFIDRVKEITGVEITELKSDNEKIKQNDINGESDDV